MPKAFLLPLWAWFAVSGVLFAVGEYVSKRWANSGDARLIAVMVAAYALGSLAWAPIIRQRNELALMGMLWMLVASACTLALGVLVFKEQLSGLQWLGVVLALVAMTLMASEY